MNTLSDAELLALLQGDGPAPPGAFELLVSRHQNHVRTNCRHLTRAPQDADDLAQEVFVKAWFALGRFEGRSSFKTWIKRIKVNHCLNYIEKRGGRRFVDIDDTAKAEPPEMQVAPDGEQSVHRAEIRQAISDILDELPDTLRLPLVMREIDQMSYQEIADTLGVKLSAVKMRIKRGREMFRGLYDARINAGRVHEHA
ncbi:MAG: RNA polymerase sigma factor [Bradymonadia bacterium]